MPVNIAHGMFNALTLLNRYYRHLVAAPFTFGGQRGQWR